MNRERERLTKDTFATRQGVALAAEDARNLSPWPLREAIIVALYLPATYSLEADHARE